MKTKKIADRVGLALVASGLLALAGCGTSSVSKNISDDGRAAEVVFPDIEKDAWQKEGTFPNLDSLRRIAPGVTKDQLYDLLGRPHFRESLVGVREWDYIFNFRTAGGLKTCQYKVIFDSKMLAQNFHWAPAACAEMLNTPAPVVRMTERVVEKPVVETRVVTKPAPAAARRIELSADTLFAFGKSGRGDLQAGGRRELEKVAESLRDAPELTRVEVVGHTDRLGSDAFNNRLSLERAATVRDYLVEGGVPLRKIDVRGRGKSDPKVFCDQKNRQALIECLAPNRRVDIDAR